jgi:hypothetical protein
VCKITFKNIIFSLYKGTIKDLNESGWIEIKNPHVGSIIVWDEMDFDGEKHKHIGFYIGNKKAISNSFFKKVPTEHHWTFEGKRRGTNIFWNDKLN